MVLQLGKTLFCIFVLETSQNIISDSFSFLLLLGVKNFGLKDTVPHPGHSTCSLSLIGLKSISCMCYYTHLRYIKSTDCCVGIGKIEKGREFVPYGEKIDENGKRVGEYGSSPYCGKNGVRSQKPTIFWKYINEPCLIYGNLNIYNFWYFFYSALMQSNHRAGRSHSIALV